MRLVLLKTIEFGLERMLSNSTGIHSKVMEVFENERYSPIAGWSAKSLMLTDRKCVSNIDGSVGWNSLSEASDSLLSVGEFVVSSRQTQKQCSK